MQSYKSLKRLPLNQAKRALLNTPIRKMSFFPKTFISNDPTSFHPLFRLLDDFDSYNKGSPSSEGRNNNHHHHSRGGIMKSFNPKFDVKELRDTYELHGELPGVNQHDVDIEFTDSQTLNIRGRTERTFTSGTPPTGLLENTTTNNKTAAHQPTIEDAQDESSANGASTSTTSGEDNTQVTTTNNTKQQQNNKQAEPQEKYWVSERSVGEFSRSFTFPVRVDSESVQASMKNGILSIVVPKAKKDQARKITIS